MRTIARDELNEILRKHKMWLQDDPEGEQANLGEADLSGANLYKADLREANLRMVDLHEANLSEADLSGAYLSEAYLFKANLSGANLSEAYLFKANLSGADLHEADLIWAYLQGADLSGADLYGANLGGAHLSGTNLSWAYLFKANLSGADLSKTNLSGAKNLDLPIVCPEKGSFIGFKKCRDNLIVELEIPEDALRSSATTKRCRCSKAKVVSITNPDGTEVNTEYAVSKRAPDFTYKVGEVVSVDNFDTNRWNECSTGIHFFMTREEAVEYVLC